GIVTCEEAMGAKEGKWLDTAGIVLVRQRPASAKGVMFITIEDETGIANLVVWTAVFEKHRRAVLSASMMAVYGRIQREGEVVHLVAHRIRDLSGALASIGSREERFPLRQGRGDEARTAGGHDPRQAPPKMTRPRNMYDPDLHIDTLKLQT